MILIGFVIMFEFIMLVLKVRKDIVVMVMLEVIVIFVYLVGSMIVFGWV